ncbi:MAG: tRNA threonylcarbamoyladenosine dehydratase [Paludibacteraceae bacterium]|nr:tRNA threonylcarbamoyladenosine dehydratase [Paludibacteraceae bacterium]
MNTPIDTQPDNDLYSAFFQRGALLLGDERMERIRDLRVILFGVGGVGSWCAEALIRTGITRLTLVDFDTVAPSNINRQLPATADTIGRPKVEAMRERLLSINPRADIRALCMPYNEQNRSHFPLEQFDVVIDCIDSIPDKTLLITHATSLPAVRFYSSMGAARKVDPTRVRIAPFHKVQGCPLARALRQRMRREHTFPQAPFLCAYSDEPPILAQKGSLVYVTAVFGLILAAQVINDTP